MPKQSSIKSALPALDRSLHILDQIVRSQGPLRYNELRERLSGIQDSSLSRILKALETYGYLHRDAELGYSITAKLRDWSPYLSEKKPDLATLAIKEIDQLAELAQESAAVVLLHDNCLRTQCSRTINEGIQVLGAGERLHFEADHAVAVAVLSALPAAQRKACLQSSYSRFPAKYSFNKIQNEMQQLSGVYIDRSQARPGICRVAKFFEHEQQVGAIFYCLTVDAFHSKSDRLISALSEAAMRLSGSTASPQNSSSSS